MSAIAVNVRRVESGSDVARDLAFARRLAWFLDAQFGIGRFRFGVDAIVGLIPWVGDAVAAVAGLYFVSLARKHGLGNRVIASMLGVILVDFAMGVIPWVGDLFDAAYKPHLRNLRILEAALGRQP